MRSNDEQMQSPTAAGVDVCQLLLPIQMLLLATAAAAAAPNHATMMVACIITHVHTTALQGNFLLDTHCKVVRSAQSVQETSS